MKCIVWLIDNRIGEQGAKAMGEMLKVNTTLTMLDMGGGVTSQNDNIMKGNFTFSVDMSDSLRYNQMVHSIIV